MRIKAEKEQQNKKERITKKESFQVIEKLSLKDEITNSVNDLKKQDEKVEEIEKSVDLDNNAIEEIKEEIHLKESLNNINNEAENLKIDILEELTFEDFWQIESIREKIRVINNLFRNLNIDDLKREDVETHASGWNVTNNIKEIENFKKYIIDSLSNESYLGDAPCFKNLINQKSYQDIIWIACSIDPEIFRRYNANLKLNAFIQERPEFLESKEFKKVCFEHIKHGMENGYLFEGYKHKKDDEIVRIPAKKIDYFAEKENSYLEYDDVKKDKVRAKRTEIPNGDAKELIVNLDLYNYDSSQIDFLDEVEKNELKYIFLKWIRNYTHYSYSSDRVFGDEIISVGKKLNIDENYLNELIYDSILMGISNACPPKNNIEKEFTEVYKKIRETLSNPEKRKEVLESIYQSIRKENEHFDSWKRSFDYMNLSTEELDKAKDAYLDLSSGEILTSKIVEIFGYSWWKENEFLFLKEERIKVFETMNSDQRCYVINNYSGSMDKLSYLPISRDDILGYAANNIKSPRHAYLNDIEQAQALVQKDFPNVEIDNTELVKKVIFKNLNSIEDICYVLKNNSVSMSPKEIIDQFNSPEDFVLKQIEGANLNNLIEFEKFKSLPECPELPHMADELFNEIKKRILKQKYYYDKSDLKRIVSFVPRKYKLELLTDSDLQETFSNYYEYALKEYNKEFIHNLSFLISKSESLYKVEQKVLDEYIENKDYHNLIKLHEIIFDCDRTSPIIKKIEDFFRERISEYGFDNKDIILNYYTLEKTLGEFASTKLNQITPDSLQNDELIREWLNIKHGTDADRMQDVYDLIKNKKNFSYFDKEIKHLLSRVSVSEKLIGTLQKCKDNTGDIDRAVRIVNDLIKITDDNFIVDNYDFLYQAFSNLSPDEYVRKINSLKELSSFISSPLLKNIKLFDLFNQFTSYSEQNQKKFIDLIDTSKYNIEDNLDWAKNTIMYVDQSEEYGIFGRNINKKDRITNLFSGDYKNVALNGMTTEWKDFLKDNSFFLPPQISIISKIINDVGGAGNLKHIESLGGFISQFQSSLDNNKTTNSTIIEIKEILSIIEERFSKEKWSQDDVSEFYSLSKDILEAAPSLYTTLKPIFENIQSVKDMKRFMSDIFPFYQTQLVIKQNINNDYTSYNPRDLVEMRSLIKEFSNKLLKEQVEKSTIFEIEKLRLLEIAKEGFKNRFGLIKVPDSFTKENLRSVQNTIRYMGNISERTPEHESLISLYLGLELDDKWGDFRGGKEINFDEYISEKQLKIISPLLEKKKKSYELLSEVSGIKIDEMGRFQNLLQEDVFNSLIGNVQTIDIKLGNIKRNIDELVDPDIYQTQKDKNILALFLENGRNVNAVLSKLYGVSTGKNIELSEEDIKIQTQIESIFGVNKWSPNIVKEIQDEIQPIGVVINMVNKMKEEKVEENISELQTRLVPNGQIIEIFNRLGEEFHQESGALALSKDLSYLENIAIKDGNKISIEEKELVENYIGLIREKMKDLENVFDHIKQHFEKIKKSSHIENNTVLKNRITEIEKVIYSQDTSSIITSQMTKDLNLIIENMRQCLGCMRKEANNDTNLAFGDYNKFFIMNQSEKEKGSISDEIVFFVPITLPDGSQEMSFVMDQVYGSKSSDVFFGNILAVYKKYSVLKKEFPNSKLSISVPSSTMSSVGLNSDIIIKRLKDSISGKIGVEKFEQLNAYIPESSLSDNYVEFGSGARAFGKKEFSGLVLR